MKKGILLILSLCMVIALAGCKIESSKNTSVDDKKTTNDPNKGEPKETTKESMKPSDTPKETDSSMGEGTDKGVTYTIESNSFSDTNEENTILYANCTYESIQVDANQYSALASSIEEWNKERSTEATDFGELSRFDKVMAPEAWQGPYTLDAKCIVERSDSKVFSFCDFCYYEQGGPHGSSIYKGYNFETETGRKITIEDVFPDTTGLADTLEEELLKNYDPDMFFEKDLSKYIIEYYFAGKGTDLQFTLGYNRITFYFSEEVLASHAAGMQQITLTNEEYPELLDSAYITNIPSNYAYTLANEINNSIDTNGDGTAETVVISGTKIQEEENTYKEITVSVNGKQVKQESYTFDFIPYFVKWNGKSYVYVQTTSENDHKSFLVFDVSSETPVYVADVEGELLGLSNPNYFYIEERLDVLSTYWGKRLCHVGDVGVPVYDSTEYEATTEIVLVSTAPLKGEIVDASTGEVTGKETFPKGTPFRIVATDNSSYIKMEASDGRVAKFQVTVDMPQTINGVNAEKCFEFLYFAG